MTGVGSRSQDWDPPQGKEDVAKETKTPGVSKVQTLPFACWEDKVFGVAAQRVPQSAGPMGSLWMFPKVAVAKVRE